MTTKENYKKKTHNKTKEIIFLHIHFHKDIHTYVYPLEKIWNVCLYFYEWMNEWMNVDENIKLTSFKCAL